MIEKRFCPKCKGGDAEPLIGIGGFTGTYRCRECGFSGSIFPVRETIKIAKKEKIGVIKR